MEFGCLLLGSTTHESRRISLGYFGFYPSRTQTTRAQDGRWSGAGSVAGWQQVHVEFAPFLCLSLSSISMYLLQLTRDKVTITLLFSLLEITMWITCISSIIRLVRFKIVACLAAKLRWNYRNLREIKGTKCLNNETKIKFENLSLVVWNAYFTSLWNRNIHNMPVVFKYPRILIILIKALCNLVTGN